ncbi:MAG: carboxypeptidase regulatory-like domain-containing protein [Desulfobacterales bacterium]|nr:MAG: carboxypeptidase regulatory-like domain-containing protein [Desulfobacterales bacterium]
MALKPREVKKTVSADVEVKVIDKKTQRPLPGATVALEFNGRTYNIPALKNGVAHIRGLPVGRYKWTASKPGYRNFQNWMTVKQAGITHYTAKLERLN